MSVETLQTVSFVAHVHSMRYNNGKILPIEIGIARVLPSSSEDAGKCAMRDGILLTVDHSSDYMTAKDRRINRVSAPKTSTVPIDFCGSLKLGEAEDFAVKYVKDAVVAVKGYDQKVYFQWIGMANVVEIEAEIARDCPPHRLLERGEFVPYTHAAHENPWSCSRMVAMQFARFLEQRRAEAEELPLLPVEEEPAWAAWNEPIPPPHEAACIVINLKNFKDAEAITIERRGLKFRFEF